ncbi:MAG: hypothetical protein VW333_05820 [Pseudomonadales bacterium]|jgi:hypothetical protein
MGRNYTREWEDGLLDDYTDAGFEPFEDSRASRTEEQLDRKDRGKKRDRDRRAAREEKEGLHETD